MCFSRPEFYDILRRRIPPYRFMHKKKILKIEEKDEENRVLVHCSDNYVYEAGIVIGADGVNSGVRQSIYRTMDEKGILPKSDLEDFKIEFTGIYGMARGLDPNKYPALKAEDSKFNKALYNDNSIVSTIRYLAYYMEYADSNRNYSIGRCLYTSK